MSPRILSVATIFAFVLTSCGGAGTVTPPSSSAAVVPSAARGPHRVMVRLRIRGAKAKRHGRGARYLSPATQSLVYVVTGPGPATTVAGGGAVNLTLGSPYCTSPGALQPLTCTTDVPVTLSASGNYTFAVATYDQKQSCGSSGVCSVAPCTPGATGGSACTGNVLSDQTLVQTLTIGAANKITISLGGVAASVTATPLQTGYAFGDVLGLTIWGAASQRIAIVARDADGNAIVGPGSPTIAVTSGDASVMTVTPNQSTNGVFSIGQTAGNGPSATSLSIALTAPSDGGGVPATNPVTVPVALENRVLVANACAAGNDSATPAPNCPEYLQPITGIALVPDSGGSPYGTGQHFGVQIYGAVPSLPGIFSFPNDGSQPTYTVSALNGAAGMAVDRSHTLYVANNTATAGVYQIVEFPAIGGTAVTLGGPTYAGLNQPTGVALDAFDTLYVANAASNAITEYLYGSLGDTPPSVTISGAATGLNNPQGVAIDANGTIYVANESAGTVTEYAANATGNAAPIATITGLNQPIGVAVDAAGAIYVANSGSGVINEYAAGAIGAATPISTHSGFGSLTYIAVEPAAVQP
jgi:sugar lactone lactonase YvrE